jgi:hypothetical protein
MHHFSMRTIGIFTLALGGVFLLICPQSKADTVYTSRSAFNSATTGTTLIDFTGLAGPTGDTGLLGSPLVIDGASFTTPGPGSVTSPTYMYFDTPAYTDGDYLAVDYGSPDTINVSFPGSTAVGFNAGGIFGNPATLTITLSDGTVETYTNPANDSAQGGTLGFFGFTSLNPITSVSVTFLPESSQFGAMDNFTYGTALPPSTVPEPSSFILLGSGLLVSAAAFRSRSSRT